MRIRSFVVLMSFGVLALFIRHGCGYRTDQS
jgi:hypothetical protein